MLSDEVKKDFHLLRLLSNPIGDVNNPLPNVVHSGRILVRFYPDIFFSLFYKNIKYCKNDYKIEENTVHFCKICFTKTSYIL